MKSHFPPLTQRAEDEFPELVGEAPAGSRCPGALWSTLLHQVGKRTQRNPRLEQQREQACGLISLSATRAEKKKKDKSQQTGFLCVYQLLPLLRLGNPMVSPLALASQGSCSCPCPCLSSGASSSPPGRLLSPSSGLEALERGTAWLWLLAALSGVFRSEVLVFLLKTNTCNSS